VTQTLIDRSPPALRRPVEVVARTIDRAIADRLPGLAAEIAFWVLLSAPALLLAIIAAAGVIGGTVDGGDWQEQFLNRAVEVSRLALTNQAIDVAIRPVLEQLLQPDGGLALISGSFLAAIWTASRAMKVILSTLAIVNKREGQRKGWQDRLLGFTITLAALLIGIVLLPLLIAGPNLGDQIVAWAGAELAWFADAWRRLYWPVVAVLGTMAIALLYHVGVPGRTRWRYELPGAVIAMIVWLLGSGGLRLYGTWILDGDSVYGSLAGPIVLLLWLWLTGFAVLLGAQLNSQLTHGGRIRRRGDDPTPAAARPVDLAGATDPANETERSSDPATTDQTEAVDRTETVSEPGRPS
jgi:membrane protein